MSSKCHGIIVGTGRAGTELHFGAFLSAGADIAAFVDIDLERARMAAAKCGVPKAFSSLEAAIQDSRPDFVSICTGLQSHYQLARLALEAGCHVLVEKPFTETYDEALDLQKLSGERHLHLSVIHNRRFYPAMQQAIQLCRSGEIGSLIHVDRKMWFTHGMVRMMEPTHWAHRIPGGRLFEANPHNLYLLYQFLGPMRLLQISASKTVRDWPHVIADSIAALFKGGNGVTAQINMSLNLEGPAPHYMIVTGTRRAVFVDQTRCVFLDQLVSPPRPSVKAAAVTLARAVARKGRRTLSGMGKRLSKSKSMSSPIHPSSWEHTFQIEKFIRYIEDRIEEPAVSWEEILEVQRLNEEMGKAVEDAMKVNK
jgi:predicted dehydrogenase